MKFTGTIRTFDKAITVRRDDRRPGFVNTARVVNEKEHEAIRVFSDLMKSFWKRENERTIHA